MKKPMTSLEALDIMQGNLKQLQKLGIKNDKAMMPIQKAIEALERQVPKKAYYEGDGYDDNGNLIYDTWICPHCDHRYEVDYETYMHCPMCGQAIEWTN